MNAYWVRFVHGRGVCVMAELKSGALALATHDEGREAIAASILPEAARPLLNPVRKTQRAPCRHPEECAGRARCPRRTPCGNR